MEQLIVLKSFRTGSTFFKKGDTIRTENSRVLIKHKLARHFTKNETKKVLSAYVHEAEKVFSDMPEK
jgi:hypothetical protein